MADNFVHLHVHTSFSTLDSTVRVKDVVARAKELGMPALAMTDHGNVFGAVDFFMACQSAGIKPILGCEMYLAPESHTHLKEVPHRMDSTHLTLLAKNETGWHNLIKLISIANLDGVFRDEPRIDRELLAEYNEGIICLSGDIDGPINEWLLQNNPDRALQEAKLLHSIFGQEDFYIELNNHGLEKNEQSIAGLADIAKQLACKVVVTNDVHFLHEEDHEAHDVLLCIGQGRLLIDENRKRYPNEVYFKTNEQMRELFAEFPEACDATLEIAEKCDVDLHLDPTSSEKYPQFDSPDGSPRDEYFRRVCFEGMVERYGKEKAGCDEYVQRLEYEMKIIIDLGFASYFLITADFINWGRDQDIPVGPGRGSAAGSLVAYAMGITDICPMRFGLLFERFLNPERVSPPDVDIDFCQTRRPEVIDYVRQKYGERCVAHIITYGTLGAKSVLRDVARVMGVSYGEADMLAKQIEAKPGIKLQSEYDDKEELRDIISNSSTFKDLWNFAIKLEGLNRNTGVHAAGVVIGDRNLDEHVALTRAKEGEVVTQCDMGAITEVGLLKMDFLGLKNLTVIQDAVQYILPDFPDFDIRYVPLDDKPTLALLNRGETMGVFQLESGGMVETCRKYGIDKIEDVIDLLAVYRPGAMQYIDEMIAVKKGIKEVEYEHPLLETICGDTYGVMIYQEQVQNAAKVLAGYTLGGADILRRAMGKKKQSEMDKQRKTFVAGAKETNDIDAKNANLIFDKIAGFAGYGFNKSHSACYGHISYWTAYLKANHPVEFLCGLLSNELNNTEKIAIFINEALRMGIEILPPDLNKSEVRFCPEVTPSGIKAIRYGLAAIKNVGEGAMTIAVKDRKENGKFESLDELSNRLDSKAVNKRILENLIKAGALDWTGETRAGMFNRIELVIASASSAQRDRAQGQVSLFDTMDFASSAPTPEANQEFVPEWTKDERLETEKELLGCYTSGHPLDEYRDLLGSDRFSPLGNIDDLDISDRKKRYTMAGMLRLVEHKTTKAGKKFGVMHLEDFSGTCEVVSWSESYLPALEEGLLETGNIITVRAQVQEDFRDPEKRRVSGSQIKLLKNRKKAAKKGDFELTIWASRTSVDELTEIRDTLAKYPGKTPVVITLQKGTGERAILQVSEKYKVNVCPEIIKDLHQWRI